MQKNNNTESSPHQDEIQKSSATPAHLFFPWFSALASLLLIGFLVISSNPELIQYYSIPVFLLSTQSMAIMVIILGIFYFIDISFFLKQKRLYQDRIVNLQQQLDTVWQSKKKQQQRANVFSGHADKLKYFISEKLLETIEYDEKYLHFKGIAAEIRHNGVISYDKIITALNTAIEQLPSPISKDQNEDEPDSKKILNSLAHYETAIDSIRYLWDLLDLSTAENMGLHIGNQLIECEEHYYQLNLDSNKQFEVTQSIPVLPTFHPQMATLMTLAILLDETEINSIIALAKNDATILDEIFLFENKQFKIELFPTPLLLGNPNHVILLLENLIKNAQFFIQKNRNRQITDRIQIRLLPGKGYAHFEIYNRGPQIKPIDLEQIFKLGYSTRRNKQHHGKGLGLYFASEIVKGYNGQITVNNIENANVIYSLQINLSDGTAIKQNLFCQDIDGKMKIAIVDENSDSAQATTDLVWEKEFKFTIDKPIQSLEIKSESESECWLSEDIIKNSAFEWLDPGKDFQPKWIIQVKPFKKQHLLTFKPLNISGVCFNIKLPTADSRLNEQQLNFD